jgi:hypothetical protein
MNLTRVMTVFLVASITAGTSVSALAQTYQGKNGLTQGTTATQKRPSIRLTTNECMGLGGDVKDDKARCTSGKVCVTQTATGLYSQCITVKQ